MFWLRSHTSVFAQLCSQVKGRWGRRGDAGCGQAVLCLFSQFHGCFGSSERHVLAPGPTELYSLHFCPHLGTTSSRSGPCQVTSHHAQPPCTNRWSMTNYLIHINATIKPLIPGKRVSADWINVVTTKLTLPDLDNLTTLDDLHKKYFEEKVFI